MSALTAKAHYCVGCELRIWLARAINFETIEESLIQLKTLNRNSFNDSEHLHQGHVSNVNVETSHNLKRCYHPRLKTYSLGKVYLLFLRKYVRNKAHQYGSLLASRAGYLLGIFPSYFGLRFVYGYSITVLLYCDSC